MAFAQQAASRGDAGMRRAPLAGRLDPLPRAPSASDNLVLDCTACDRFGLRGPGVVDWIRETGRALPGSVNTALTLPDGTAILRLGEQEIVMLPTPAGTANGLDDLRAEWTDSALPAKGYDAFREEGWAWFVATGPAAPDLMRRISMADLRPSVFGIGRIAQTRALQLDCAIARFDRSGAPSYDLLFDIASSDFAFDVVTHAASGLNAGFTFASSN